MFLDHVLAKVAAISFKLLLLHGFFSNGSSKSVDDQSTIVLSSVNDRRATGGGGIWCIFPPKFSKHSTEILAYTETFKNQDEIFVL